MDVRVERCSEKKLVGLTIVGRRRELSLRVPPAWLELVEKQASISHRIADGTFYGVFVDDDHAGDGHYRYWVAVEVSEFGELPEGMVALTIPPGNFAVARIEGGPEKIDEAYLALADRLRERRSVDGETYGFERYEVARQAPTPPYDRFDYDVFRPLGA